MNRSFSLATTAGLVAAIELFSSVLAYRPAVAQTPSASELVEAMIKRQKEELGHVRNYWIKELQNNTLQVLYYENRTIDGLPTLVLVPRSEYPSQPMKESDPNRTSGNGVGGGHEGRSDTGRREEAGGVGPRLGGSQSNTLQMGMGRIGTTIAETSESLVTPDPALLRAMAARSKVTGTMEVDGRKAWVLRVDDLRGLDLFSGADDADFIPTSATLVIDPERRVSLRDEFIGVLHGSKRPQASGSSPADRDEEVHLVVRFEDYRNVDGLVRPFHTVIELYETSGQGVAGPGVQTAGAESGAEHDFADRTGLGEKAGSQDAGSSQEDIAKARQMDESIKKLKESIAKLPPEQRARVEPMIRRQMAMLNRFRQMMETQGGEVAPADDRAGPGSATDGPVMTLETVIRAMKVNAGPPGPESMKQLENTRQGGTPEASVEGMFRRPDSRPPFSRFLLSHRRIRWAPPGSAPRPSGSLGRWAT